MKRYLMLILIFISIFIFTNISSAKPIIEELNSGIEVDADLINVEMNYDGSLYAISYIISSTRLNKNSTITYQTSEIHVKLGNKRYVVKTDALKEGIKPDEKQGKVWHKIHITAEEIKNTLSSEMDKNQLDYYMKNPNKIQVGAKIDIMQNGEAVATIENEEDIETIAGYYNFTPKHFEDMRSRFKSNEPIIPKEEETTPKTGLRPTIIIDDSEEDY